MSRTERDEVEADQTAVIHLLLFLLFLLFSLLLFSLLLFLFLLLSLLSLSLPFERDEVEADQTAVASSLWCLIISLVPARAQEPGVRYGRPILPRRPGAPLQVHEREALPFLALRLPFCQRLMPCLRRC